MTLTAESGLDGILTQLRDDARNNRALDDRFVRLIHRKP